MKPEIEATFVNINKDEIRTQLQAAGAQLIQPELLMQRTIFDLGKDTFARVRNEGNRITMSYKHLNSRTLSGMQEICLEVNNYDDAIALLKACGLRVKAEQEAYREEWKLDDADITIDTWPWIPTYLEIEGPTETNVQQVATKLGFSMKDALYGSADDVYKLYYDIKNDDIDFCPEIKFTPIPDWLASKQRPQPLHI